EVRRSEKIGRGTGLHPEKADVTMVDIVDASRSHRLVTLPTLFGLPADFDLAGHTTALGDPAVGDPACGGNGGGVSWV
ncbi:MAG: hypothetical protein Q8M66_02725, partial [Actinomycetota bacterium]|nr:hypothetical protein [Actinomycetota bacterium]